MNLHAPFIVMVVFCLSTMLLAPVPVQPIKLAEAKEEAPPVVFSRQLAADELNHCAMSLRVPGGNQGFWKALGEDAAMITVMEDYLPYSDAKWQEDIHALLMQRDEKHADATFAKFQLRASKALVASESNAGSLFGDELMVSDIALKHDSARATYHGDREVGLVCVGGTTVMHKLSSGAYIEYYPPTHRREERLRLLLGSIGSILLYFDLTENTISLYSESESATAWLKKNNGKSAGDRRVVAASDEDAEAFAADYVRYYIFREGR